MTDSVSDQIVLSKNPEGTAVVEDEAIKYTSNEGSARNPFSSDLYSRNTDSSDQVDISAPCHPVI